MLNARRLQPPRPGAICIVPRSECHEKGQGRSPMRSLVVVQVRQPMNLAWPTARSRIDPALLCSPGCFTPRRRRRHPDEPADTKCPGETCPEPFGSAQGELRRREGSRCPQCRAETPRSLRLLRVTIWPPVATLRMSPVLTIVRILVGHEIYTETGAESDCNSAPGDSPGDRIIDRPAGRTLSGQDPRSWPAGV